MHLFHHTMDDRRPTTRICNNQTGWAQEDVIGDGGASKGGFGRQREKSGGGKEHDQFTHPIEEAADGGHDDDYDGDHPPLKTLQSMTTIIAWRQVVTVYNLQFRCGC